MHVRERGWMNLIDWAAALRRCPKYFTQQRTSRVEEMPGTRAAAAARCCVVVARRCDENPRGMSWRCFLFSSR